MINLQDEEAKKVAQVITNDTCRKILDSLADKESTETELSKKLELPISTIHYNLQQLLKSGLVIADEYHYSKRMKEVLHYKLANQYIIIAPKTTSVYGIKEKLKSILPVLGIGLIGSSMIYLYHQFISNISTKTSTLAYPEMARTFADDSIMIATTESIPETTAVITQNGTIYAIWFFIGCIFIIISLLIIDYIKYLRRSK